MYLKIIKKPEDESPNQWGPADDEAALTEKWFEQENGSSTNTQPGKST